MTTRTPREIRADLDAVNDELETINDSMPYSNPVDYIKWRHLTDRQEVAEARRRRLEAELTEARAIEAQTPDMFAEERA